MDPSHTLFVSAKLNATLPRTVIYDVCVGMPSKITSDGIWADPIIGSFPSQSSMTILELQIIVIFTITQCFHFLLKRLGFPFFVSQIATGLVLGPSLKIGWLTKYKKMLFPFGSEDILASMAILGYAFFLFLTSVQMDFSIITRTGKKAWTIALCTVVTPAVVGLILFNGFRGFWTKATDGVELSLDLVVINQTCCSFAVIASLLSDLDILNSELGRLALSSAVVSDVLTSISTAIATVFVSNQDDGMQQTLRHLSLLASLLILTPLFGRPAMNWVVSHTLEGRSVRKVFTYIIVLLALIVGSLAGHFSLTVLGGMIVYGFVVPEGPPLGSELVKQFELLSIWFFMPLFITTSAMKVDITLLGSFNFMLINVLFIAIVQLIKLLVCMGICQYCKMPKRDGLCLSLILISKGVVDFSNLSLLYDSLKITSETTSILMLSALMLGSIARIGLKSLYDPSRKYGGYQKRNILHLKPNSELRIVACIQKPSHIMPIKDVLDFCCPSETNPLVVHVLHLMELVGRSSPIFISHRLQERVVSGHQNFSGDVIVTFDLFEHDHAGAAIVNTYTAVSPQRLMQEDICNLALDKLASMIILPFHVRWAEDGSVDSEDENIRAVNNKVLARAPCSVGILVNRGPSCFNEASKHVAMIFLGGPDDREALCLARRTIKDSANTLVVYHLVGSTSECTNWDLMLDEEVLKTVKGYYGSVENATYEKITIDDPSQTTNFVLNVANRYDYIIVGRRNGVKSSQTAQLDNWTEYSELGVIGDLLASSDTNTKASILVVQQQQMPKS